MPITTIQSPASSTDNPYIVSKFKDDKLTLGSQIIVNESEEALLFENGQFLKALGPGRHLLESGNIPGLDSLIEKAFNRNSPVICQVWFVNKTLSFEYKWGLGFDIKDPSYAIMIPLGGYGSYALRVVDPGSLVIQLVGKNSSLTVQELKAKLLPMIERNVKDLVAETVVKKKVDVFTIETELRELSEDLLNSLGTDMSRYGLELTDFFIQGLDIVGESEELQRIKNSLSQAADIRIRGKAAADAGGFYERERALDALNKAAENEGGLAGTFLTGGLGLGLGVNAAQQIGKLAGDQLNLSGATPNDSQNTASSSITSKLQELKQLCSNGLITKEDYEKKKNELLKNM